MKKLHITRGAGLKRLALGCAGALLALCLAGCGGMTSDTITVDAEGNYAYAPIGDADYYVVRFFTTEDIDEDGTIKEGSKAALKQTLQAAAGTTGTFKKVKNLAFGEYIPTIYGLYMDKTTTETVLGDPLVIGGTLTAPEILVQNDYGSIKVAVTDKSFEDCYFAKEKLYSFTAEVYTDAACTGDPVATADFGSDAAYIEPTNSSKAVWIRNQYTEIPVEGGTYYVRCRANGNADDQVEDSAWSEVTEVTADAASTQVTYCTITFDPAAGTAVSTGDNILEFGNGAQMFTDFAVTDDANTVKEGDLYTLNGVADCDLHLMGAAGDTSGEAYTCGPRLMPVDKPDIRGTWTTNADGTITITMMADYQYYLDEADKKTT